MAFALESARRGGRYVAIGLAGKPVTIPFDLVCFHELTVTSGFASTPSSWRLALELLETRAVDLEPLALRGGAAGALGGGVRGLARRRRDQVRARPG